MKYHGLHNWPLQWGGAYSQGAKFPSGAESNLTGSVSYGRMPIKEEVTSMCWEREEPKKASEEIDEILKKIVKEAEKEEEAEAPARAG